MNTLPNRNIRYVYCVALSQATVIPLFFGVLSNVFSAFRISGERTDYVGRMAVCLFLLGAFSYRVWAVIRNPEALESSPSSKFEIATRALGIAQLWIGAFAIPSLAVGVIILLIVNREAGIAFGFFAPLWIAATVGVGFIGVIVFEAARLSARRSPSLRKSNG